MNLLVCLKQILDPEVPIRDFRIDAEKLEAEQGSANLVTNIFCENALETALQLRDRCDGEITALCFGPEPAEEVLRKALALKVDHAYLVENPGISQYGSSGAAMVLAAAIEKLPEFDLIVLGREAGDWGEGQTAGLLAERLGMPSVSFVDQIEPIEGGVRLRRQTDFGSEQLTAQLPIVASITNSDTNLPRIPKTRDIMLAHRKPLTTWSLEEIGLDEQSVRAAASATEVISLNAPEKTAACEFVAGDSSDERINDFAERVFKIIESL